MAHAICYDARVVPDEPVRGRTPPPWFRALSGIERMRAFSRGLLPAPPLWRLFGIRTTHVAAGTVTTAMPASDACIAGNGQLEIAPVMMAALEGASITALPGGADAAPMRFTFKAFRPAWPGRGNLVARARVVNDSHLYVFTEVHVEDPDGRHVAQGSLHSRVRAVEPAPPPPPETIPRVEVPVYETPDPWARSFPVSAFAEIQEREHGLETMRGCGDGRHHMPVWSTWGLNVPELEEGRGAMTMPASEWFCALGADVSAQALSAFCDMATWCTALSLQRVGTSVVVLDSATRFLLPVPADGRAVRAMSITTPITPEQRLIEIRVHDADARLVAVSSGAMELLDRGQRMRRPARTARRILATLLFTDIVESTTHAQRLGDTAWRRLLEEHNQLVRREVSRCNGTEVTTTGDGFLVRFDAPAHAIEAAQAIRRATTGLGLRIRAGVHVGECEADGAGLTGVAVHVASRIQAAAAPGEILVSSTVKDLAVGSAHRFEDRGERELKGVAEPCRLFAVADAAS